MTATTTWDGLPVSDEPPYGATVVVYRWGRDGRVGPEILLLHRAHHGPAYDGDWAWTPPAGSRFPGEAVLACARRELREEAGLELAVRPTACGSADWALFLAEAPLGAAVSLEHDREHDRYAWLPADEAVARCRPAQVAEALGRAVELLCAAGGSATRPPEEERT
jgi:8-oxo-dGTP pyrophosphatase MutT (NUDIX family)